MLAGRRWRVVDVDGARKEITVRAAKGGNPPIFGGDPVPPHDGVVQEMLRIYGDLDYPAWLDRNATQLLSEARASFDRFGLRRSQVVRHRGSLWLFPWVGERRQQALVTALVLAEIEVAPRGLALAVPAEQEGALRAQLARLATNPPPDPLALAALVPDKVVEKFDHFLGDDLLTLAWARDRLDVSSLPSIAAQLLGAFGATTGTPGSELLH